MGKALLRLATMAMALWSALSGSPAGAEDFIILPPPFPCGACAEEPLVWPAQSGPDGVADFSPFTGGRVSLEANSGVYYSQRGLGPTTPRFDFAPVNFRLGMVLNDPFFPGCLRGSFQVLAELTTAPVFDGFGNIVVGPTALLRYNYVQPNWRLVPYLQGGAGFAYTDAYQDYNQHAIGQAVEFQLKAAAGFHYFINEHLSLDGEAGYIHISNADLAPRNLGINSVGGTLGLTFYFP